LEFFEGGDEDDFFAIAEAEELAKLSAKKKKKKKKVREPVTINLQNSSALPPIASTRRGEDFRI
jgi:hypothetical protein